MKLIILTTIFFLFSLNTFSQSKGEISAALEQMKKTGMFTQEQIEKAKRELASWDEKKLKAVTDQAKEKAKDPKIRAKALEINKQLNGR